MHAAALEFQLHIPECHSLKQKRGVLKPIIEGSRRRFRVAAAEVAQHEKWQRADVGIAAVAATHAHLVDILDEVERFVWSFPDVQVLRVDRHWMGE